MNLYLPNSDGKSEFLSVFSVPVFTNLYHPCLLISFKNNSTDPKLLNSSVFMQLLMIPNLKLAKQCFYYVTFEKESYFWPIVYLLSNGDFN